jgi:hypothetical protein
MKHIIQRQCPHCGKLHARQIGDDCNNRSTVHAANFKHLVIIFDTREKFAQIIKDGTRLLRAMCSEIGMEAGYDIKIIDHVADNKVEVAQWRSFKPYEAMSLIEPVKVPLFTGRLVGV